MAVDRKGDYYNPPSDYQDLDGNWKTFTYVDHDKHTSRTQLGRESQEAKDTKAARLAEIQAELRAFKEKRIQAILDLPACDVRRDNDGFMNQVLLEEILIRGTSPMTWNDPVMREACNINEDFLNLLHTRVLLFHNVNNLED